MTITQEPTVGALYFQKSVPDILLVKNDYHTSVVFELKNGATVILTESYVYDVDGTIRIRNLGEIVEKYFTTSTLLLGFSYTITEGITVHTVGFTVLKCEADMTVTADAWTAINFLTRAYREKRTSKSRNEYLSFLQKASYGLVTVNFKVVYLLNSVLTELTGVLTTLAASVSSQVTTFNASLGAVTSAAALAADTEILQVDMWCTGTGFEMAKYTYLIDDSNYRDRKYFVYTNCFGVLETYTATGRTDNKKTAEYNLGNIDNHYRKITQDFVAEKTLNSGHLSETEMEWIDDLLLSYNIATYTPGISGADDDITLTAIEKTDSDANELQSFTYTYRRAKNNHVQFTNAARGIFDATFDATFN